MIRREGPPRRPRPVARHSCANRITTSAVHCCSFLPSFFKPTIAAAADQFGLSAFQSDRTTPQILFGDDCGQRSLL